MHATERGPFRLLIIEDDPEIRDLLAERLAEQGYVSAQADTGDAGLERILGERFDCVLLDIGLPGIDGFETLQAIRREYSAVQLPVIILTGYSDRESLMRGLRLGANDFVAKPIDFAVLHARLQTQLTLKRASDERAALERDLAKRAADLELANRALATANRKMESDLEWAGRLQRAMLPTIAPAVPGVEFAWHHRSCEELGGDLLNVFAIDDEHVGLYMMDVSGHGIKAALLSVQVSRLLALVPDQHCLVRRRRDGIGEFEPTPPADVAEELNRRFPLDETFELYFTLFYGVLDTRTLELRYVCAGHPGPIHIPADEPARDLTVPMFAIGWMPAPGYEERRVTLRAGDRFFLYSDGIGDARDANNEVFGVTRTAEALRKAADRNLDDALQAMLEAAGRWRAHAIDDDISALAIEVRRRPVEAAPVRSLPMHAVAMPAQAAGWTSRGPGRATDEIARSPLEPELTSR